MKKSVIIAGAVAAIMAGSAIADTTVYGRARMGVVVDAGNNTKVGVVNKSSRFGFKGSEDLGNGMAAIYHFELGYTADEQGGGVGNRIGLVGVKGDFGTVAIGSAWTPIYNLVSGQLDPLNAYYSKTAFGRSGNVVAYINKFGAVNLQAAVVATDSGTESDLADAYNIAVSFPAGPVNVGVGYHKVTNGDNGTAISAVYKGDGFAVGAGYEDASKIGADKLTTALASFNFTSADKIVLTYQKLKNADKTGTNIGYEHNLSKRSQFFIENSSKDLNDQTIVGLKVNF